MNRCIAIALIFILTALPVNEQAPKEEQMDNLYLAGTYQITDDASMPYQFHVPENINPDEKYPLLLFLHGDGSLGTNNQQLIINGEAELCAKVLKEGPECFILAPQAVTSWIALPPVQERKPAPEGLGGYSYEEASESIYLQGTLKFLDEIIAQYPVDTNRIYLHGYSRGAMTCNYLLAKYPDRFAAAVVCAGSGPWDKIEELTHTPIYIYHGTDDDVVPFTADKALMDAVAAAGGEIVFKTCQGNKHGGLSARIWPDRKVVGWLFSQSRADDDL